LTAGATQFDEPLSDDFEALPGQKADSDVAAKRLAAQVSAIGDWSLFNRRLARDGLTLEYVLARFTFSPSKRFRHGYGVHEGCHLGPDRAGSRFLYW
jgi:hypothetical protein